MIRHPRNCIMNVNTKSLRRASVPLRGSWSTVIALALAALSTTVEPAQARVVDPTGSAGASSRHFVSPSRADAFGLRGPSPVLAKSWFQQILGPIEHALGTRQAMLQFGAVGMALGLFIIWYRRP
jgi:hypothetical protein